MTNGNRIASICFAFDSPQVVCESSGTRTPWRAEHEAWLYLVYDSPDNDEGNPWEDKMKTIGLLGGMTWESTVNYYKFINQGVKKALGGAHSAKIVMISVDFDSIARLQMTGEWLEAGRLLAEAAQKIQTAGADFLLICANTMHKVLPQIEAAIDIPVIHIADAAAEVLLRNGVKTAGLLGTAYTMEQDFYKARLKNMHGIDALIPNAEDREIIHDVIYDELDSGILNPASKANYLEIIAKLASDGADAVILGCTEIGILVNQDDTDVMLLDTTAVHAQKAVELAIQDVEA